MLSYIKNITNVKICHTKLYIFKHYDYDAHNKIENGYVKIKVLFDNKQIGFVNFALFTGQVGFIEVEKIYRRQNIANFMLTHVEKELLKNNITNIWVVCSKNHYFWSVQKNYIYTNQPHTSVTGSGYLKQLDMINTE
jgi:hypothetical protein